MVNHIIKGRCAALLGEVRERSTELYRLLCAFLEHHQPVARHKPFLQLMLTLIDALPEGSTEIPLSLDDTSVNGSETTAAVNLLSSSTRLEACVGKHWISFSWPCDRVSGRMAALAQDCDRQRTRGKNHAHFESAVGFVHRLCVAYTRTLQLRPVRVSHTLEAMNAQA